MRLIRNNNGVPTEYSIFQLRQDNPNVSFPTDIPETTLAQYNCSWLVETPAPAGDVVTEITPTVVSGKWTQTWQVRAYTPDEQAEIAENTAKTEAMLDAAKGKIVFAILRAVDGDMTEFNAVKVKLQTVATRNGITVKKLVELIF